LRREGGETGFSLSLFKRGGQGVNSKGARLALISLHFSISPCPVEDVGHDQPRGRERRYPISLWEKVRVRDQNLHDQKVYGNKNII